MPTWKLFQVGLSHLTECINQTILENELPHKIVNLLFTVTDQNIKLTILWGS